MLAPLTRPIELPSPKSTRADDGVRFLIWFAYVTVNLKSVVGVPLPGDTPPLERVTLPQDASSPSAGATNTNIDAATQTVSANAPPSLTLVPLAP